MARRPLPTLALPALGFAVTLGVAMVMTARAEGHPAARMHRALTTYLEAVYAGDAAAASRAGGPLAPSPREVRPGYGTRDLVWFVERIEIGPRGDTGRATVHWIDEDGRGLSQVQVWGRDPDGRWTFRELED